MIAIFNSFLLVLASEMGDKTQLLALVLAARFARPWPIMAGILVATLANHGLAAWVGGWLAAHISPETLRIGLTLGFLAFAVWILIPDKDEELNKPSRWGAFLTTAVAFFLAEMGDKTQIATVALGVKFQDMVMVTAGTTLGMLAADGMAVYLGNKFMTRIPLKKVRIGSATLFVLFAASIWFGF